MLSRKILSKIPKAATSRKHRQSIRAMEIRSEFLKIVVIGIAINRDGYVSVRINEVDISKHKVGNMITSTYVKDNEHDAIKNFLRNAINEKRVLFYDKTKSQVINSILRVSFPNNLDKLDFSKSL